ncbi:uncharacterized protein LOC113900088 isoform X2 [Bos indicus x Bos taurus]|uniref:proline, histidine and glycine-rich protein 1 n=1 Tax=Bos taurus TaxID=9913 RepID=UPI0000EBD144|nr:proline, histidine and glycine-rich protein 1 [Bos taurus]XP_019824075.1 PREDICTED: uncharacterized protein LOC109564931 isoform X2 [Bos indicus]XP_019824076.1 PREDICTED: uncharacterized protein LOC109564931 isoform X2 [Bos indicus]XP_027409326.1 uncharacterized protein LOC113900088 isoform X2 [Bos indicus x Bos taurus]XP_027409327.1 uncharacterized protein LOC113900088 isoform X2 [Bos indicus x Bos taurus]
MEPRPQGHSHGHGHPPGPGHSHGGSTPLALGTTLALGTPLALGTLTLHVPTLDQGTVLEGATHLGPLGIPPAHITEEAEETRPKNGEHDLAWGLNQNLLFLINSLLEAIFYS